MKGQDGRDLSLQDCAYHPVILTGIFGFYKDYGQLPRFFLYIKPAIIAIILGAIFPLAKKSLKTVRGNYRDGFAVRCCSSMK
jgi:chromate transport protein ChrA